MRERKRLRFNKSKNTKHFLHFIFVLFVIWKYSTTFAVANSILQNWYWIFMENKIKHSGVVESVNDGCVSVKIIQSSACAICKAAKQCHASESKEKIIEVFTKNSCYIRYDYSNVSNHSCSVCFDIFEYRRDLCCIIQPVRYDTILCFFIHI